MIGLGFANLEKLESEGYKLIEESSIANIVKIFQSLPAESLLVAVARNKYGKLCLYGCQTLKDIDRVVFGNKQTKFSEIKWYTTNILKR